ncbi:uncharacterized protein BKA55DRAFT_555757 [Fusarium redolens]|jgi:hypothetical protein|uniref:Uncharacterized protein n=1 Tax=Fusarium redolens TaxID=48865 RepID=A0A9P9KS14_FUSRE|nr:uncharacterized protein BKA55DRAFT_555757 [Fusarium redolens]KAH7267476.1 hypothetical protein BKA55DRAFT_555757 [Fusarium redolens]
MLFMVYQKEGCLFVPCVYVRELMSCEENIFAYLNIWAEDIMMMEGIILKSLQAIREVHESGLLEPLDLVS